MQLTKLRAAPERQDKVPPCAPAGQTGGVTASQLIASVGRTLEGRRCMGTRLVGFSVVLASAYGCVSTSNVSTGMDVAVPGPTVATDLLIAGLSSPDPSVR